MEEKEILEGVCQLVSEHLEMPLKLVKECVEVPFLEYHNNEDGDPYCDGIDFQELLLALEDEFDIEIPFEEEDNLTTINDVVRFIANYEPSEDDASEESSFTEEDIKEEMYKTWVKMLGKEEADKMVKSYFG